MARGKFISYLRVSTDKQGRSGLGLEAQRKAVEDYLDGGGGNSSPSLQIGQSRISPVCAAPLSRCSLSATPTRLVMYQPGLAQWH